MIYGITICLFIIVIVLLICKILLQKVEIDYQRGLRIIDAEYLRHHISSVIYYRKLKSNYKKLKRGYTMAGIIDKPIVKSVLRKHRFKIKEIRNVINSYYFMHTAILREKK
jgi:hypothetical protein